MITNKTGRDLSNLSVSPDMGGENADAWPFKTDYQKYEQKIGTLPKEDGKNKIEISFDFVQTRAMPEHADMPFHFLCMKVIVMSRLQPINYM